MSITFTLKSWFSDRQSNEVLMLRYANSGTNELLAQLYDACANDLYHFLLLQSDSVLAKDISQRTWLKVIEKKHLYRDSGSFKAWLFTLGRNALIDELRKNKRIFVEIQDVAVDVKQAGNIEQLFDCVLRNLPFEQREAFSLQQEGFGLQEISNMTHVGIETVKSRVRYAKNTLRTHLEKHHD